jgi:hypothetical protein
MDVSRLQWRREKTEVVSEEHREQVRATLNLWASASQKVIREAAEVAGAESNEDYNHELPWTLHREP